MVKITSSPLNNLKVMRNDKDRNKSFCPFNLVKEYQAVRPLATSDAEQFFVFQDSSPVTPAQVRKVFTKAITVAGLEPHAYTFHCLRSGRASGLLKLGLSVETIKKIGRWRSNAIFTYLRN